MTHKALGSLPSIGSLANADTGDALYLESGGNSRQGQVGTLKRWAVHDTGDFQVSGSFQPLDADLTAIAALTPTDGNLIVGAGATWVAESGATARTSLGLGTGDSPEFAGVNVGHATDTTITRASAGNVNVEGNLVYRAGGTDVPVTDGGSGRSTATAFALIAGGTTDPAAHQSLAGLGTAGQVLTSNGAGALPTFQTGNAGGITTIASGSLPAAATQTITDIPDTFAYLVLQITGVSSNTTNRQPFVRVSTNNGSSYDATVGNYQGIIYDSTALALTVTAAASLGESALAADAASSWNITIQIFGYHTGPHKTYFARFRTSGGITYHAWGTYIGSTDNIDALQILWSGSGNFDAGTYALYGVS